MNCPKCGFVQPDGMPDCQRCQVIFSKWQARQTQSAETMALPEAVPPSPARSPVPPPPAAAPAMSGGMPAAPPNDYLPQYTYIPTARNMEPEAPKRNWGILIALLVVAGLVAWGGWAVFTPESKGLPVVEGSYHAPDNAFAIMPPDQWVSAPTESVQVLAGRNSALQSESEKQALAGARELVSFVKSSAPKSDPENISVISLDLQIPHLTRSDREDAEKSFIQSFTQSMPGIETKLDESALIKVDKLQALRFVAHATGTNKMTRMSVSVYLRQVLVPGDGRTYLINCVSMSQEQKSCEDAVGSFRVLKRPTLAGGSLLFRGTLRAGFIGAGIGLFVGFIRWLLGGS